MDVPFRQSRGGYHVVIPNDKKLVGVLYQKYNLTPNVEIHNKQVQVPIPGTLQGVFWLGWLRLNDFFLFFDKFFILVWVLYMIVDVFEWCSC